MQLHAVIRHPILQFRRKQLRLCGIIGSQFTLVVHHDAAIDERMCNVHFSTHVCHFESSALKFGNLATKCLAFIDVVHRHRERRFCSRQRAYGAQQAFFREKMHELVKTAMDFAKQIFFGHFDVVKK